MLELYSIASDPSPENVFTVTSFVDLGDIAPLLIQSVCDGKNFNSLSNAEDSQSSGYNMTIIFTCTQQTWTSVTVIPARMVPDVLMVSINTYVCVLMTELEKTVTCVS